MSGDAFELNAPDGAPGEGEAPAPVASRSRRGRGGEDPTPEAAGSTSWPRRLAGPLVSPTGYYLIGFLFLATVTLSLFNPKFGALAELWPHELLGAGALPFEWHGVTVRLLCILTVLAGYVVALLMRPGVARGLVVAAVTLVAFVTFQPEPALVRYYVLPVAIALVGGALIARTWPGRNAARNAVLLVGFALVAAHLFLPWESARVNQKQLRPGYYSTAVATVDYYVNPPEMVLRPEGSEDSSAAEAYGNLFLLHVPGTIACLMFLVALAGLVGLGRGWARWAAGFLLVAMVISWGLAHYLHGRGDLSLALLEPWQAGLRSLAKHWHESSMAYALPLAGAVAELVRGRTPR